MGIQKDVLVWQTSDLSSVPLVGSTFTVTGSPDVMAFEDDEANQVPKDFDPALPAGFDLNQTLSGTLGGAEFNGNNNTQDVFEFEYAYQVSDGTNTFNIYQINNYQSGGTTTAYVSEVALDPNVTYTVLQFDDGVNFANGTGYETTPVWADLAGHVDGTSGDDIIGAGYVDEDDDRVDGNDGNSDVILGEGGGDTITSGAGHDLIYGDHVDDIPAGTTEYIAQGFVRDADFELQSGSLSSAAASVSISGTPQEIRFIDDDGVLNGDNGANETPDDTDQLVEISGVLYSYSADYVIQMIGSDGNVYDMLVIDVDRNSNGLVDGYSPTTDPGDVDYENGQILIPRGNVPPPNVLLTAFGPTYDLVSENYSALNGAALVSNYDDSIDAGSGNDTVFGGQGDDVIAGGLGNDIVAGGAGADTLTGGAGADEFVVDSGGDVIADFDTSTGIEADFIDLTQFYNAALLDEWNAAHPDNQYASALGWLRADQEDGVLDQAGNLQLQNGGFAIEAGALNTANTGVVCFANGTLIATARGEVAVEDLKPGDLVQTMDHGLQPIRWIGAQHLSAADLDENPKLQPVRISPAVIGLPDDGQDLVVSPQHRILVTSKVAQRMLGEGEVLIAANKLLGLEGVEIARERTVVSYYHLLCDEHEILFANGIPAESLYLGNEALKSLSPEGLNEIRTLFPELDTKGIRPRSCRKIVSGKMAKNLCYRHAKNHKAINDSGLPMHSHMVVKRSMGPSQLRQNTKGSSTGTSTMADFFASVLSTIRQVVPRALAPWR